MAFRKFVHLHNGQSAQLHDPGGKEPDSVSIHEKDIFSVDAAGMQSAYCALNDFQSRPFQERYVYCICNFGEHSNCWKMQICLLE